ncbi:MAG: hypothetical protein GYA55_03030 [SAR324 cluster bacterium]|uniref:Uncharacterized protein n=1 Tax=SAR324 cluster bacterium TaxID=2024889 RepID=A0A7X9FPW3_9DELT|nr:hypothetical protein [SAR324 cluster bacterium]
MGLNIVIDEAFSKIEPNGRIKVQVSWVALKARSMEINLLWFTSGKGDEDVQIIETKTLEHIGSDGERSVEFELPDQPYSFSGKLISLHWAIEAVPETNEESKTIEFILSPTGKEVVLKDSILEE